MIYKASATCASLTTAITRFYTLVLAEMFLVGVEQCKVFITPSDCKKCYRRLMPTIKEYQANRYIKVFLPLKEPLKNHLIANPLQYDNKNIIIIYDDFYEADDLIMQYSYELKEHSIVNSGDKDLRLTPYPYWESKSGGLSVLDNPFGYIYMDKTTIKPTVKGHGIKFYHAQLLMGDQADNVCGLTKYENKLIGAKKTFSLLENIHDEVKSAELIIQAYIDNNQFFLSEAECLFIHRNRHDSAFNYFMNLNIKEEYKKLIVKENRIIQDILISHTLHNESTRE